MGILSQREEELEMVFFPAFLNHPRDSCVFIPPPEVPLEMVPSLSASDFEVMADAGTVECLGDTKKVASQHPDSATGSSLGLSKLLISMRIGFPSPIPRSACLLSLRSSC